MGRAGYDDRNRAGLAIRLNKVSKKYRLFGSSLDRVKEALDLRGRSYHQDFWALRDIDLELSAGKTIGVLGLNGSGKSTLLQIVSSVLQPTSGTVEVNGRVAALLELGAGFDPELTGRENVRLNAAIMGLTGRAIAERMEAIRDFADIGEFFDQPMKTCSSGMFMRVAFGTAIHVDPDILLIDEALSVGDARFQEKCFRRFRAFQQAGKTILFVTHDRSSIPRLCNHAILLDKGRLIEQGDPGEVVEAYGRLLSFGTSMARRNDAEAGTGSRQGTGTGKTASGEVWRDLFGEGGTRGPFYNSNEARSSSSGAAEIVDFAVLINGDRNPGQVLPGDRCDIAVRVAYRERIDNPLIGLEVRHRDGTLFYGCHTGWLKANTGRVEAGDDRVYRFSMRFNVGPGHWFVSLALARDQNELLDYRGAVIHIEVIEPRTNYTGLAYLDTHVEELANQPATAA